MGRNLVPATLGNIIGGAVFVGTSYALSFGTPGHAVFDWWAGVTAASQRCLGRGHAEHLAHTNGHAANGHVGASSKHLPPLAESGGPPGGGGANGHAGGGTYV